MRDRSACVTLSSSWCDGVKFLTIFRKTSKELRVSSLYELWPNFERTSSQLSTNFGLTSNELRVNFVRTLAQLRTNFELTSCEVNEVRTSLGNIISVATVYRMLYHSQGWDISNIPKVKGWGTYVPWYWHQLIYISHPNQTVDNWTSRSSQKQDGQH